jgi:alanine dehydrogenase
LLFACRPERAGPFRFLISFVIPFSSELHLLLLNRNEVQSILSFQDYVSVVEKAFCGYAYGETLTPVLTHLDAPDGELHIKAGGLLRPDLLFGIKVNAGFPSNQSRYGLPNIQGVILLSSAENGTPLALMDSREITVQRTAAATALAARHLARPDSTVCTICGSGTQARAQLRAISQDFALEEVLVWSRTPDHAVLFAREMQGQFVGKITPVHDLPMALSRSSICVTCTSSRYALFSAESVPPGMFIAAVGADGPTKQELDPALIAKAKVVTDLTSQAISVGDSHHAVRTGLIDHSHIHGELGEVLAGMRPGRENQDEIIVFDSTGTALQDVAAAAAVYAKAVALGVGTEWTLA